LLLALALLALPTWATTPESAFGEANKAYEEGRYDEAAERYLALLNYRIEDPRLEYNLGNAEFKRGRLGYAILHYERARRLAPTDPDILANLEYARARTFDRVESEPLPAAVRWVYRLQDRLGPDRQAWGLVTLVWIAAVLLAWGLARPGRWSAAYGWTLAGLLLAGTLTAVSWSMTYQRLEGRPLAVVLVPSADVLAGPGLNNATLFTAHEGLTVEVRGELREEWIQVSLPNGLGGWIPRDAVGLV